MENTTEVHVITLPVELAEAQKTAGLEPTKAESILVKFAPFFGLLAEIKAAASKIDFENPTALDCEIAGSLRKRAVKVRTASEAVKDENNKEILLLQKVSTHANGLVANSAKLLEQSYEAVEKHAAIKKAKEEEALKIERSAMLAPYVENTAMYPLGQISQTAFNDLLQGFILAKEKKIADEAAAELARITKEQEEAAAREAQRIENVRLKAEADAREAAFEAERVAARAKQKQIEAIAEQERVAKEKLQAEMKAKEEAERKAKHDAEAAAAKEAKEKAAAEKKAANAPDKEKLLAYAEALCTVAAPVLNSAEADAILSSAATLVEKIRNFIIEKTENL